MSRTEEDTCFSKVQLTQFSQETSPGLKSSTEEQVANLPLLNNKDKEGSDATTSLTDLEGVLLSSATDSPEKKVAEEPMAKAGDSVPPTEKYGAQFIKTENEVACAAID
ncbi:hypothetical protein DFH06DRAFT_1297519 [Mycena polygramma]|nr:hypothetical protein DFH06DRAFT_1297519 [Mycena polygramma]